jgi:hypothetical protein
LKLDKSAAWRRLSAACDEGYIVNLEQRRGMPGKYRAHASQKIEPMAILPTTADLVERFTSMSLTQSAPESVQPCTREKIPESVLGDNGCTNDCNPVADCTANPDTRLHGCNAIANGLATDNRSNGNEKSPPVARLRRFSEWHEASGWGRHTFKPVTLLTEDDEAFLESGGFK